MYKSNKNGTFKFLKEDGSTFVVNGHRIKRYFKSKEIHKETAIYLNDT